MDITLIETLRWEPKSGFVRLERHLTRLKRSAETLRIPGADGAEQALSEAAHAATSPQLPLLNPSPQEGGAKPLRVRLELFADGRFDVKTVVFAPLAPDALWKVKIAAARLHSDDALLRHKTSRRTGYEAARAEFTAGEADEVLLLNERNEVCEGTITSVFLDDGTGILKTPPLDSGLLAGVLREELIETGRAIEQRLFVEDLHRHRLFVGNSLRGLIPASLA